MCECMLGEVELCTVPGGWCLAKLSGKVPPWKCCVIIRVEVWAQDGLPDMGLPPDVRSLNDSRSVHRCNRCNECVNLT